MSNPMSSGNHEPGVKPITGRHVFIGLVIFFGVIFLMNGVFLYYAVSTHTGVDTTNAYRRGLDYNSRIASQTRQTQRGWTPVLTLHERADKITLRLKDRSGLPVPNLVVTGLLGRPATNEFDLKLTLKEISPGRYEVGFEPLKPGNWVISIEAVNLTLSPENTESAGPAHDQVVYRLRKRLWLKPAK